MLFESMTLQNFMRYEGENRIEFSCDPEKNVTVILGDNTVGKTTIAQAFRWCLYGKLLLDSGKKETDYHLLNNDVSDRLTPETKGTVSVEIVMLTNEMRYVLKRDITYTHRLRAYGLEEHSKHVSLKMGKPGLDTTSIEVDTDKIRDVINELLPENLSSYFLFDGERWSDVSISGVRTDIKDSVHILTGVSSLQNTMKHLKDMGSQSVMSKFRSNIHGSGNKYNELQQSAERLEREITTFEGNIRQYDERVSDMQNKIDEINGWLDKNKNTETMQREFRDKKATLSSRQDQLAICHKKLVEDFSSKAFMLAAEPMVKKASALFKSANLQKRDIPYMHQATIDYLIERGKCICGASIKKGSSEYDELMDQRSYLVPADIGTALGNFEQTASRWTVNDQEDKQTLTDDIFLTDNADRNYRDASAACESLSKEMNEHVDFSAKRQAIREYQRIQMEASSNKGEVTERIRQKKCDIKDIDNQLQEFASKDAENQKWQRRYKIADELYNECVRRYDAQERKVFKVLNSGIEKNFETMFHEKDKRIELDSEYNIRMLYRKGDGYTEEKNLSEGEKVARNFAFIVTMMKSGCRLLSENSGLPGEQLPIVLDGPFSKLGEENIPLIAQALPSAAEQVIIFMLDKDWKYTGLDEYVGSRYHIDKNPEDNFASVRKVEA